jgi:hypothetical protein
MDGFDRMGKRASDLCGTRVRLPTSPRKKSLKKVWFGVALLVYSGIH